MFLTCLALIGTAGAADPAHTLTYALTAGGEHVGTQTVTVRYASGAGGQTSRTIESTMHLKGLGARGKLAITERITAHAEGSEPVAFHARIDQGGQVREVQGRWTPTSWVVTTLAGGKPATAELPPDEAHLSTADWLDPLSGVGGLALAQEEEARVLSAERGDVQVGPVRAIEGHDVALGGGGTVSVQGVSWTGPAGLTELHYASGGFLVKFRRPMFGAVIEGTLQGRPPGGVDDFPLMPAVGVE